MLISGFLRIAFVGVALLPLGAKAQMASANGQDVTSIFQKVVNDTPAGGTVVIPPGHYRLSGTINITKPITIFGSGLGSQIFESSDTTLLRLTGVNGAVISNVYLGSAATSAGTSLVELVNSNHNRLDNITMLGSNYGVHLKGSLLNTMIDIRSGTNFQGFYAPTSTNQTWVYAEAFNSISANANTFIAPVLEGGVNGISITDSTAQGSLTVVGGTIEGVSGAAVVFNQTFLPSSITGTHFEANGSDITIRGASNITLDTILSLSQNLIDGSDSNVLATNIRITGGIMERLTIGQNTSAIRVENISTCLNASDINAIVNNNNGFSTYNGSIPLVTLSQIVNICYGRAALIK